MASLAQDWKKAMDRTRARATSEFSQRWNELQKRLDGTRKTARTSFAGAYERIETEFESARRATFGKLPSPLTFATRAELSALSAKVESLTEIVDGLKRHDLDEGAEKPRARRAKN